jgi:leader peptidase (prepilin peptidase)/N-methyltransferase
MEHHLQIILAFVLGCVIGSFLNVVRHRLPRKQGVVTGRSRCPSCGRVIAWHDNIPLVSFLLLRGRCRACGWRIPSTYFIIESATGLSYMLIWQAFSPGEALAYLVLASLLIVCAGIDYDHRIIPDKLTLPGVVLGLVLSVTMGGSGTPQAGLLHSGLGIAAGAGILLVIGFMYKVIRGVEGMGGGDVKLMAMVGAFLGLRLAVLTIFVASLVGGIAGIVLLRKSSQGMKTSVPFGVFLSPAAIFSLLWGKSLIEAYLRFVR